jgi:hypothetical protein
MSRVFCETWDSTASILLRILGSATTGKGTTSVVPQASAKPRTTVEERRFSAASSALRPTGLQPQVSARPGQQPLEGPALSIQEGFSRDCFSS